MNELWPLLRATPLFVLTATTEIMGCYLPYLWLRRDAPVWVLLPAVASLALFAWLLTLHPTGAGRTYAAYGGVYVASAMLWVWAVEGLPRSLGRARCGPVPAGHRCHRARPAWIAVPPSLAWGPCGCD
jgi:small multidrug resistance family-3 protein